MAPNTVGLDLPVELALPVGDDFLDERAVAGAS
jgi:hypothetical protein